MPPSAASSFGWSGRWGRGAPQAEGRACEVSLWLTGRRAGRCGCQERGQESARPEQGVWSQRRSSDFAPRRCSVGREAVRQGAGEPWRGPRGLRGGEGGGRLQQRRGQRGGRTEARRTCRDTRPGPPLPPLSGASMGVGRTPPPGAPVLGVCPTCQTEEPLSRAGTHQASPPEASRWLLRAMFRWHMAKRSAPTSGETEGSHEAPAATALHLRALAGRELLSTAWRQRCAKRKPTFLPCVLCQNEVCSP